MKEQFTRSKLVTVAKMKILNIHLHSELLRLDRLRDRAPSVLRRRLGQRDDGGGGDVAIRGGGSGNRGHGEDGDYDDRGASLRRIRPVAG